MAKVAEKEPVVREIAERIDGAQAAVLVDARGLTVAQDTALRKELRQAGVLYKVYKNTMMHRAFENTDYAQLDENNLLNGPSALAISKDDPAAPARVLVKFAKTAKQLEVKGGIIEGKYYDAQGLVAIADIPSREVLLSKLLGSIQSPIANFARVVKQIAEKQDSGEAQPEKADEAPAEAPAEEAKAEEAPVEAPAEAPAEEAPAAE